VAEKHTFFGGNWLKNVRFLGGSSWKTYVFRAEVAEKHTFFWRKWLKNVLFWLKNARFSGVTG
jgi:hypothetical protein